MELITFWPLSQDVTSDAAAVQRSEDEERREDGTTWTALAAVSVVLLAVAFLGAATAGVLDAVGPYLLGVSALVLALFAFGRR